MPLQFDKKTQHLFNPDFPRDLIQILFENIVSALNFLKRFVLWDLITGLTPLSFFFSKFFLYLMIKMSFYSIFLFCILLSNILDWCFLWHQFAFHFFYRRFACIFLWRFCIRISFMNRKMWNRCWYHSDCFESTDYQKSDRSKKRKCSKYGLKFIQWFSDNILIMYN